MLNNTIEFISPLKGSIPEPKAASFFIPQAYKDMVPYVTNSKKNPTVKKCIPFLDALTSGYIIPFAVDIEYRPPHVAIDTGQMVDAEFGVNPALPKNILPHFEITSHGNEQISNSLKTTKRTYDKVFKFSNPWVIKTPPGYSSIFLSPLNHQLPFELVSSIVDTDEYQLPIKFPFYWTSDPNINVILKQGSPMVMVIPFKRESWKSKTSHEQDEVLNSDNKFLKAFSKVANNYKNKYWKKKSFR